MDYEMEVTTLDRKQSDLDSIKTLSEDIYNEFNSGYLNQLSGTEISPLSSQIKQPVERLKKGVKNSNDWYKKYIKELIALEEKLTSFTGTTMESPKVFSKKFEDLFSKKTMNILKTGGDIHANSTTTQITTSDGEVIALQSPTDNDKLRAISVDGQTFYVADTRISVEDYAAYIRKNKMYQGAGFQDGQCMILSQYYATDMISGKYTSKGKMNAHQGGPACRINERCKSTDPNKVLQYCYSEINQGHPVVLQVSQVNSYKGARHLVTMVGFTKNVKSWKDLTPDNILVLDCVDGKIQTLGKARSQGGHERRLFAQGGNDQALGPTNTFLNSVGIS